MLCIQANVNQAPDPGVIKYKKYCKDLCLNNIAKLSPSKASASAEISCIFDSPTPTHPRKVPKFNFLAIYMYTSMEDDLNGK